MPSSSYAVAPVRFLLTLHIAMALVASVAAAQQSAAPVPQSPGRGARGGAMLPVVQRGVNMIDQTRQIAAGLNLSAEQVGKLDAAIQSAREDLSAMTPSLLRVQPPQRREQVREFLEALPAKIKPILNESQAVTFNEQFTRVLRSFPEAPLPPTPGVMPATQPGAQSPRVGMVIERLNDYVNRLGLSQEQSAKVQRLFADTRQELLDLRGATEAATPAVEEKAQTLIADLRTQLVAILQPQQAERLRDLIARGAGNTNRPMDGMGGAMGGGMTGPEGAAATVAPTAPTQPPEIPLIEVGQAAPDFSLKRLDGQTLQLSSLKGRYVLLIFGSYTSPSFRSRAAALEQLKLSYGTRLNPLIIYTRENHPAGEWNVERNKDEGIAIEQPKDMDARLGLAKQARTSLKLTVPILLDSMEDATAKAYGAVATNSAVVIDRDGKVVARQKWFEPYALRRMLDEAMKPTAATE